MFVDKCGCICGTTRSQNTKTTMTWVTENLHRHLKVLSMQMCVFLMLSSWAAVTGLLRWVVSHPHRESIKLLPGFPAAYVEVFRGKVDTFFCRVHLLCQIITG